MESQIWVTNESTTLSREIYSYFGDKVVVNYDSELDFFRTQKSLITDKNEIGLFDPTLSKLINKYETDFIIHSMPMSYEEAVDYPVEAIHNNLESAYNLALIAKKSNVKIIHINFPVYKTLMLNNLVFQGAEKNIIYLCNETVKRIYDIVGVDYVILNPPILYSELPNNIIYDLVKNNNKEFYIDPEKRKSFMHMKDFVKIINSTIFNFLDLKKDWYDVPPSEVTSFEEIINRIEVEFNFNESKDYYYFDFLQKLDSNSAFSIKSEHSLLETIRNIKWES